MLHPQGLAVAWRIMAEGAMPVPMLVEPLRGRNYCVTFKTGGNSRPFEKFSFQKGEELGMVLTTRFLQIAGFNIG